MFFNFFIYLGNFQVGVNYLIRLFGRYPDDSFLVQDLFLPVRDENFDYPDRKTFIPARFNLFGGQITLFRVDIVMIFTQTELYYGGKNNKE